MSFFRKKTPIYFNYVIDGISVSRVSHIQDLGVWFDEQLTFSRHIDFITSKALSMLGFVKRTCRSFTNLQALKSVYVAHVRSYLEYASVVWHPYYSVHLVRIESVQKQFLIYALRRTVSRDANHRLPPYLDRCNSVGIEPLWRRRINVNVCFVFDLLRQRISAPELLSKLRPNVPSRSFRNSSFFVTDSRRTKYGRHEPFNSLVSMFNAFAHLYDSSVSREVFRSRVRTLSLTSQFISFFGLSPLTVPNDD